MTNERELPIGLGTESWPEPFPGIDWKLMVNLAPDMFGMLRDLLEALEGFSVDALPGGKLHQEARELLLRIQPGLPGFEPQFPDELKRPFPPSGVPHVYFIQSGEAGPIKIGFSIDVEKRMQSLQCCSSERLFLRAYFRGASDVEGRLHWKLRPHRLNGEWFSPHADVMAEVERHSAQN